MPLPAARRGAQAGASYPARVSTLFTPEEAAPSFSCLHWGKGRVCPFTVGSEHHAQPGPFPTPL